MSIFRIFVICAITFYKQKKRSWLDNKLLGSGCQDHARSFLGLLNLAFLLAFFVVFGNFWQFSAFFDRSRCFSAFLSVSRRFSTFLNVSRPILEVPSRFTASLGHSLRLQKSGSSQVPVLPLSPQCHKLVFQALLHKILFTKAIKLPCAGYPVSRFPNFLIISQTIRFPRPGTPPIVSQCLPLSIMGKQRNIIFVRQLYIAINNKIAIYYIPRRCHSAITQYRDNLESVGNGLMAAIFSPYIQRVQADTQARSHNRHRNIVTAARIRFSTPDFIGKIILISKLI